MGGFFSQEPKEISEDVTEFVNECITRDKIVIFSKSYCPYCSMAKEQFKKLKADFATIELDGRPDCNQIQDVMLQLTGARSVPRVFVNGTFVGGGSDVKAMYENGSLAKLLA